MIWLDAVRGKHARRPAQSDQQFRACHGQALAGPNVERNALPAPGIDLEAQSHEGFHFRIGRHALLRSVAAKLPANDVILAERRDRFQDFDFFIPD